MYMYILYTVNVFSCIYMYVHPLIHTCLLYVSLIHTCIHVYVSYANMCVYCLSHFRALPVLKIVTLDLRLFAIKVHV